MYVYVCIMNECMFIYDMYVCMYYVFIESKDSGSAYIWKEDMKNIEKRKLVWISREIEVLLLTDIVFIAQVTVYLLS